MEEDKVSLRRIEIQNFKSLKKTTLELGNFNVLIGPNASGKTNVVEVFRLIQDIIDPGTIPFARFGGYKNAVWRHNEELPIVLNLNFGEFGYEVVLTGIAGQAEILGEKTFGYGWEITVDRSQIVATSGKHKYSVENKENLTLARKLVRMDEDLLDWAFYYFESSFNKLSQKISRSLQRKTRLSHEKRKTLLDNFEKLVEAMLEDIPDYVGGITAVSPIPRLAKNPSPTTKDEVLDFYCENLHSVLHTLYLEHNGLPKRMLRYLKILFPDIEKIRPVVTEEGNVILKITENGVEFRPRDMSDGFYKVLCVLTAIELDSDLIIIDEIENSVHPETAGVLIDALRKSGKQVILTTHSPAVLEVVDPEEVLIVSKESGETKVKKLPEPERLRKKLSELGISLGESWLLGGVEY